MEFSIQQVSEKMQIRPTVLRFYEKEGLLPSVRRSKERHPRYGEEESGVDSGLIMCLKNTGMSIKQIRDFVDLSMQGDETLKERCEMLIRAPAQRRGADRGNAPALGKGGLQDRLLLQTVRGVPEVPDGTERRART
jgi:DNA-binding transcriptional MerR regulator